MDWRELDLCDDLEISQVLYGIAQKCTGISGRSLRKLPFLAHARYIRQVRLSILTRVAPRELRDDGLSGRAGKDNRSRAQGS